LAKIQEIVGVITQTLDLRREVVQGHLEGLRAAQRIVCDDAGPVEAADLLAACLCTDPSNATAAYHLPFVGAECSGSLLDPRSADLEAYRCNVGQALAMFLDSREIHFGCASEIAVSGQGASLRASITAVSPELGRAQLWFGYQPASHLMNAIPRYGVFHTRSIGSAIVQRLGSLLCKGALRDDRRFVDAALRANTPAGVSEITVH
jgi:hypothetical protein